ncbi:DUF5696 domain-containing protein [Paenibacillus sp. 32O-W]|uniref:DUF5696 domain-containing protein n=1 Tax=Paenibacillus sp. 32O-W TaxID=1695218 RepID=UPI001CD96B63|nr:MULTISPECIES: DUF5696 domain-containing protein [Paenibacillaceae]
MIRFMKAKRNLTALAVAIVLSCMPVLMVFAGQAPVQAKEDKAAENGSQEASNEGQKPAPGKEEEAKPAAANPNVKEPDFPKESAMQIVADNGRYQLKADPKSGHFIVVSKQSEQVWRSYPDPQYWSSQENSKAWRVHLKSPFMFRFVEFKVRRDLLKESNYYEQSGKISSFERINDGFKITYEMPNLGFVIPVQVRLKDDYVETTVLEEGLKDVKEAQKEEAKPNTKANAKSNAKKDPEARLVSLRLFPFFGAQASDGENGFLLIPDGSGALIDFKKDRANTTSFYNERIYGEDWAYSSGTTFSNRLPVRMPVFGIKDGDKGFVAVAHQGAEYASVLAAPSKSFSQYNWTTVEQIYRFKHFQPSNTRRTAGFYTYSKELTAGDRSVRYYLLEEQPDYARMAGRYRQYLMEEVGYERLPASEEGVRLQLHLLGGDTAKGFLWDSYLPLTTTDEAEEIVRQLHYLGVEDMSVVYLGWQKGGYSKAGGHFPVDRRLGGNGGMKRLADFVRSKGFSLFLDARSYTFNNTGRDGFRGSRDGLRDQGSSVIRFRSWNREDETTFVSPRFMEEVVLRDMQKVKELGVDGLLFGDGIGDILNTDYNERYSLTRTESLELQRRLLQTAQEELGRIQLAEGNVYAGKFAEHWDGLSNDYSYDLFVDRTVPFAQIALHGLVSYSFEYANLSGNYTENYLRGIEYGAEPSFVVTSSPSQELLKSKSLNRYYSTYYKDWLEQIVTQYQLYNDALSEVRTEFITDHRALAKGVMETTYANGHRVVVNYNAYPYSNEGLVVQANDFAVIRGGQ